MQVVELIEMGTVGYQTAWDYQEQLLQEKVAAKTLARQQQESGSEMNGNSALSKRSHHLLLLEHPPVYTLGKSGHRENILITEAEMQRRGIDFFQTNRGGDITFHGPGQLVGYPLLDLEQFYTDIGRYLRNLEDVVIRVLARYGLRGERSAGETGVWLDPQLPGKERKICAIGVRCSRWVTMHGFAFNVNTDLDYFNHIVPCGIVGKQVTSLAKELGRNVPMEEVIGYLKFAFEEVFEAKLQPQNSFAM